MPVLLRRRYSRRRSMTGMSLRAILSGIVYTLGAAPAPGVRLPVVASRAMTPVAAMTEKVHHNHAGRRGKPYPIVLKPVHAKTSWSGCFKKVIATLWM